MKNRFGKIVLLTLCVVTLLSAVPAHAAEIDVDDYKPDPWYTAVSTTGDCIEFPREKEYLSTPYVAKVYAIQRQISIYLMPQPEKGHGNLGTVGHGKRVLILAKSGGYLFFLTQDGRYGWNGSKYFDKVSNSSAYYDEFPSNGGYTPRLEGGSGSYGGSYTPSLEGGSGSYGSSYTPYLEGSSGSYGAVSDPDKLHDGTYYARVTEVWTTNAVDKAKFEILELDGWGPSDAPILKSTGEHYSYNLHRTTIIDADYLSRNPAYSYRSGGERLNSIYDLVDRYGEVTVEITIRDGKLTQIYNYYKP